jgi:hypothetical protein
MTRQPADTFRHFLRGLALVVVVQTVFMAGGLLLERLTGGPVTGLPTVIGLTLVLVLATVLSQRSSEYVLLGSFTLAFLSPLLLFLILRFKIFPVEERLVYFSMGYLCALILAVWFYLGFRIWQGVYDD